MSSGGVNSSRSSGHDFVDHLRFAQTSVEVNAAPVAPSERSLYRAWVVRPARDSSLGARTNFSERRARFFFGAPPGFSACRRSPDAPQGGMHHSCLGSVILLVLFCGCSSRWDAGSNSDSKPSAAERQAFLDSMLGDDSWLAGLPTSGRPAEPGKCSPPQLTYEEGNDCAATRECENDEFLAFCDSDGCACTTDASLKRFTLSDSVDSPCEAISHSCQMNNIIYDQSSCPEPSLRVTDHGSCSANRTCDIPVKIGSIEAVEHDDRASWCTLNPDGGVDCGCRTHLERASYHFTSNDLESGCLNALEICSRPGRDAAFENTSQCAPQAGGDTRDNESCTYDVNCLYTSKVNSEITRTALGEAGIECHTNPAGAWYCDCQANAAYTSDLLTDAKPYASIEVVDNQYGSDICSEFRLTCDDMPVGQAIRDGICTETSRETTSHTCSIGHSCELPTTLKDVDVVLHHDWNVECFKEDPVLGWKCQCTGTKEQILHVQADTLTDACDAALAPCEALVHQWVDQGK